MAIVWSGLDDAFGIVAVTVFDDGTGAMIGMVNTDRELERHFADVGESAPLRIILVSFHCTTRHLKRDAGVYIVERVFYQRWRFGPRSDAFQTSTIIERIIVESFNRRCQFKVFYL